MVLVVHSGAGAFAWALASAIGAAEVTVVFADAGLPAAGPTPVVDDGFLPYLREIAADGVVPPWPQWFPDADPAELFPTDAARAAVEADARPLPLAFFEEQRPARPPAARRRGLPAVLPRLRAGGGAGQAARLAGPQPARQPSAPAGRAGRGGQRPHRAGRRLPVTPGRAGLSS